MQWAKQQHKQMRSGFTIVELLIVVVVIAILAAITIVSYNGITRRASEAVAQSALDSARKKIELYGIENNASGLPPDLAAMGLSSDDTVKYTYSTAGNGYCVTTVANAAVYHFGKDYTAGSQTVNSSSAESGPCPGHGEAGEAIISNYVSNPSAEVSTSGYSNSGGSTIAQSGVRAASGSSSMLVTLATSKTQGNTGARFFLLSGGYLAAGMKPNTVYTVTAYVYVPAATVSVQIQVTGTGRASITAPASRYSTVKDQWQRLQCTITTAATDGPLNMYIMNNETTPGSATQLWADNFMVYEGSSTYQYGDGNTDNWVWSGTADLSSSWGPAIE